MTLHDSHLPQLCYVHPTLCSDNIVADTYHRLVRWDLLNSGACTTDLVGNRMPQPAFSSTGN